MKKPEVVPIVPPKAGKMRKGRALKAIKAWLNSWRMVRHGWRWKRMDDVLGRR